MMWSVILFMISNSLFTNSPPSWLLLMYFSNVSVFLSQFHWCQSNPHRSFSYSPFSCIGIETSFVDRFNSNVNIKFPVFYILITSNMPKTRSQTKKQTPKRDWDNFYKEITSTASINFTIISEVLTVIIWRENDENVDNTNNLLSMITQKQLHHQCFH